MHFIFLVVAAPKVVVIGVDGLRPDAARRWRLPTLTAMMDSGVSAEMVPARPAKTFPNLYTLATGVDPAEHGIVDNKFTHPTLGPFGKNVPGSTQDARFFKGEPLWVAWPNSAVVMWLGADAVKGAKTVVPFDKGTPTAARAEKAIALLPSHDLVMVYFDVVDQNSHDFGWASAQTQAAGVEVDAAIARIVKAAAGATVFVVSDHGMAGNDHGGDPNVPAMFSTFIAAGPGVPHGRLARFRNTQVKPFVLAALKGKVEWPLLAPPAITSRVFIPGYKGSALKDANSARVFLTFWQAIGVSTPSLAFPSPLQPDGVLDKVAWEDVYAPWLARFNGSSFAYDWRRANLDTLEDLVAHIQAQPGPVELIGHSLGGLLALAAAERVPVARVTIVGSPARGGTGFLKDVTDGVPVGGNGKLLAPAVVATFDSVWSFFPLQGPFYSEAYWKEQHINVTQPRLDRARAFRELLEKPKDNVRVVYSRSHDTQGEPGDGRVKASAAFPERFGDVFESGFEHAMLMSDPEVADWLLR